MTPLAIVMMLVAVAIIWGGLAASIVFLRRHPAPHGGEEDDLGEVAGGGDVTGTTRSAPAPGRD